jgi:hypothetical protein
MHTGQTALLTLQLPVSEFCQDLANMVKKLTQHHFVAKAQPSYQKQCKETCLILKFQCFGISQEIQFCIFVMRHKDATLGQVSADITPLCDTLCCETL